GRGERTREARRQPLRRLSEETAFSGAGARSSLLQGDPGADLGHFEGELAFDLGDRGLDGLSPGRIQKVERQAAARQRRRRNLTGERLSDEAGPPGLNPEKSAVAGGHSPQDSVGRSLKRSESFGRPTPHRFADSGETGCSGFS